MTGWHIMRGDGSGTTLYFGRHRGARYVGIDARGFNGWSSYPHWMPGGWEFFTPTIHYGRLFTDGASGFWETEVKVPYKLVRLWRMRKKSWRDAMREEPMEAVASDEEDGA